MHISGGQPFLLRRLFGMRILHLCTRNNGGHVIDPMIPHWLIEEVTMGNPSFQSVLLGCKPFTCVHVMMVLPLRAVSVDAVGLLSASGAE